MIFRIEAPCDANDYDRLCAAGLRPVVRWVELGDPKGETLKTVEALTLLDRRAEAQTKPAKKAKPR
jgi:hypothetical protein